ncbi:MAG: glycosyltransferase family 2 protein, partial [Acidobacteriota bacterium]
MPATVSVVIINYNGSESILDCLESVDAQTQQPDEVIVVDNASTDDSPALICRHYPHVRLIESPENLGYAGGCNLGIRESSGDLIAVLNNDLRLHKDWLKNLADRVEPPWSFWASMIVFASEPRTVDSAGDAMAVVGSAYKIGHGDDIGRHSITGEVFGPCG